MHLNINSQGKVVNPPMRQHKLQPKNREWLQALLGDVVMMDKLEITIQERVRIHSIIQEGQYDNIDKIGLNDIREKYLQHIKGYSLNLDDSYII